MSRLGDYVYLKWGNYHEKGTFPFHQRGSNYDEKVFENFQKKIMEKAKKVDKIRDQKELEKYQIEFNKRRKTAYNKLKKLLDEGNKNSKETDAFFELLLKKMSKSIDDNYKLKIDMLKKSIVINEKSQSISIDEDKLAEAISDGGWRPLPGFSNPKKYSYLSTIEKYINIVVGNRNNLFKQENQNNGGKGVRVTPEFDQKLQKIKDEIQNLKDEFAGGEGGYQKKYTEAAIKYFEKREKNIGSLRFEFDINFSKKEPTISPGLAEYYYKRLNILNRILRVSISGIKVAATFAEVIAEMTDDTRRTLVDKEILKVIEELKNTSGGNVKPTIKESVKKSARETVKRFGLKNDFFEINAVERLAEGKIDASIKLLGKDFNISMKNYDLSKTTFTDKSSNLRSKNISLVDNTSLNRILLNAENYQKTLGTHFLNVLSKHEDNNVVAEMLRDSARAALEIFIMYIALTGGHGKLNIRKEVGADVIIVEDKTDGYCYFFSISNILNDILQKLPDSNQGIYSLKPSVKNLLLENKMVESTAGASMGTLIKQRIANLLGETKSIKYSAGLSIENYINQKKRRF